MSSALAIQEPTEGDEIISLPCRFGEFLLFDHIGRGGMADIYLGTAPTGLGGQRRVVVKRIRPHLSQDEEFSGLLAREARIAARLNHANIVQVISLGREEGSLYIAMEYVEGLDLNQLLRGLTRARIPLPAENALVIVIEVLRALDYAHRFGSRLGGDAEDGGNPGGVIHRDVSPSNVLISMDGEVRLCDFGIARALDGVGESLGIDASQFSRMRVAGKSAYMSPEHARGDDIDRRADVFSAGILMWELCAGRRLYRGTEEEMLAQAREGKVPQLPERGMPNIKALHAILARALAPDREARYPSAAAMLCALEAYVFEQGWMASPIQFGEFLKAHFGHDIIRVRRRRERQAEKVLAALRTGPPVVLAAVPVEPPRPTAEDAPPTESPSPTVKSASPVVSDPQNVDDLTGVALSGRTSTVLRWALWTLGLFSAGAVVRWLLH